MSRLFTEGRPGATRDFLAAPPLYPEQRRPQAWLLFAIGFAAGVAVGLLAG